jgi:prepilin-type N-terminal cleavage/methylation domain-containing protein
MNRYRAGFTLLEIALVMAVIAIVISTAIPNYRPLLNDTRFDQAVEQFKGDLFLAREMAKTYKGCEIEFRLEGDLERYRLIAYDESSNPVLEQESQLLGGFGFLNGSQGGMALPDDKIKLDQNGSPGLTNVVIEIGDPQNQATVTMYAETGRVEVTY